MTQAERRHDRLAVRLSLIISRLVAGETLSVRKLAAEFGVSVRTLRRDFRERLMYLDLEYQSGYCRLRTAGSETQMVPDVLTAIDDPDAIANMEKLLDVLEDNDDVQDVWHNWDRPDED